MSHGHQKEPFNVGDLLVNSIISRQGCFPRNQRIEISVVFLIGADRFVGLMGLIGAVFVDGLMGLGSMMG